MRYSTRSIYCNTGFIMVSYCEISIAHCSIHMRARNYIVHHSYTSTLGGHNVCDRMSSTSNSLFFFEKSENNRGKRKIGKQKIKRNFPPKAGKVGRSVIHTIQTVLLYSGPLWCDCVAYLPSVL